jgi:tRNA dimethylallyltransferase
LAALQHELAARLPGDRAGDVDAANPRRVIRALEQLEQHGTLPAGWRAGAPPRVVGLRMPRALLHRRIEARVQQMFADGLLAEVDALRRRYPAWRAAPDGAPDADDGGGPDAARTATARQAIGYAEACDLLDKRLTRAQAIERIAARTRQLAKRQETWFRHQAEVHWIDLAPDEPVPVVAERVVAAWSAYGPTPIRLS